RFQRRDRELEWLHTIIILFAEICPTHVETWQWHRELRSLRGPVQIVGLRELVAELQRMMSVGRIAHLHLIHFAGQSLISIEIFNDMLPLRFWRAAKRDAERKFRIPANGVVV